MANCPNCGAELAPSVLSCAHCRMPLPPGSGVSSGVGQPTGPQGPAQDHTQDHTVVRPGTNGYLPSQDASWTRPPEQRAIPLDPSAHQTYRGASAGPPPTAGYEPGGPPPPPPEDPRERRQRRNTITLIVLAAVVLAIGGAPPGGVWAAPKAPTTAPVTQAPPPPTPSTDGTSPSAPSSSATTPTPTPEKGPTTTDKDAQTCSPGLQVPAKGTSCEFARAVRAKVAEADKEAVEFSVRAHSSVTKKDYTMKCVRNSVLTTCTGGNNAVVWIHNGG